ncbi:thap domain protein [Anaeramoeba flamelloides]|uniref:Thap domain protein n=1 Tax=Anaeramoeba flamelloides TaxID=1746091 RepID=A0ABQ8Y0X2_9EUKA|nr:thap domain protein [Anaeramoeba flamelloides]
MNQKKQDYRSLDTLVNLCVGEIQKNNNYESSWKKKTTLENNEEIIIIRSPSKRRGLRNNVRKRGRKIKKLRPVWCNHQNRPEHPEVCYLCSQLLRDNRPSNNIKISMNFQKLLNKLEITIDKRELLTKNDQLLLTLSLYRLAIPFRVLGFHFNVSTATALRISKKVTFLLNDQLGECISWPNNEERKIILQDWTKQGWSNIIGAIDCTEHSRFRDLENEKLFHSGKQKKSTIMSLAVCDTQGLLFYFKTGILGHNNDQGAFNKSEIKNLLGKDEKLLGDGGFSVCHFIVPFGKKTKNFNEEKRLFNIFHSQSRVIIENVFAHLKKNKICQILIQHDPDFQSNAIKACALIYNFKILEDKLLRKQNWIPKLQNKFKIPQDLEGKSYNLTNKNG